MVTTTTSPDKESATKISILSSEKIRNVRALFIFLSIFLVYIIYSLSVYYDFPQGDHWRWIKWLLIPYVEGKISFWEYVTGDFYPLSHSHLLTLTSILANYYLFDLRYDLEAYIGTASYVIFTSVIVYYFFKTSHNRLGSLSFLAISSLFLLVLLNPRNTIFWSQVQFEHIYLLIAAVFIVCFDKFIKNEVSPYFFYSCVVIVFFVGDAMGITALFSVITYLLFYSRRDHFKHLLFIVATIAICALIAKLFISGRLQHDDIPVGNSLSFLLSHLVEAIKFILNAYGQSILTQTVAEKLFGDYWQLIYYLCAASAIFFSIRSLVLYGKNKQSINTTVPAVLVLFTAVSITLLLLLRLEEFGAQYAYSSDRYLRLYNLGIIGAIWIHFSYYYNENNYRVLDMLRIKSITKEFNIVSIIGIIILVNYAIHSIYAYLYLDVTKSKRQEFAKAIMLYSENYDFDLGNWDWICANHVCESSVRFLKNQKLSVFRSDHPVQLECRKNKGDSYTYIPGRTIAFGENISGDFHCTWIGRGWSARKAWGFETIGSSAKVMLPLSRSLDHDLELTMDASVLTLANHSTQKVDLFVNDQYVGNWNFSHSEFKNVSIKIPRSIVNDSKLLQLSLRLTKNGGVLSVVDALTGKMPVLGVKWIRLEAVNDPG